MIAEAPQYPSERSRMCPRNHYTGTAAVCPVCGYEDLDKLEDRAVAHAERLRLPRPTIDESEPAIVVFSEREVRGLDYIRHARLYGRWQPAH